ncbi:MAG: hypothetical protein EOP49_11395 [Sphingobacteriales bacterium]|nr:MAG: hypothetical protein EOP49_11395 [Sphingobacteriales bacterium]
MDQQFWKQEMETAFVRLQKLALEIRKVSNDNTGASSVSRLSQLRNEWIRTTKVHKVAFANYCERMAAKAAEDLDG